MGQSFRIVAHSHTMKMLVVLALAAAARAEPEAEADPLTYLTNYPSVYSAPSVASPLLRAFGNQAVTYKTAVATPAVTYNTVAAPAVTYKAVASPVVSYNHAAVATPAVTYKAVASHVVTYNHAAVATPAVTYNSPLVYSHPVSTHSLTSYKNPEHYTAVSNGTVGPSYIAKNGPTVHVVKREADADPALVYNTLPLPYNSLPATTYNTFPVHTYNTLPVAAPAVTYKAAVAAPAVTYKAVASPVVTYNHAALATPAVTYNSPLV